MSATSTADVREAAARLKKATASALAEIATMRQAIAAKRAEIKAVLQAPLPKADVERRAREEVKAAGERFMAEVGVLIARRLADPAATKPGTPPRRAVPWTSGSPAPWGLSCAVDPDAAVAALLRVRELAGEGKAGPAASERQERLLRLQPELVALEAAEEGAVDAATSAGVRIEHRPEVLRRREAEAAKRQREAEVRADAERRQRALDAREQATTLPTRGAPSSYLASKGPGSPLIGR